jgi:transglutaminase-like putative cysteine protease
MAWGFVPKAQLAMTMFTADSNATAIVLFDVGDVTVDQSYAVLLKRHTRIKILTRAGFHFATHVIPYDVGETVRGIEGHTILLSPDGKTTIRTLNSNDVFDEDAGENRRRKKFTMPTVAPGCVIEFRYTVRSSPGYVRWDFQTTEPTLWSELRTQIPSVFQFATVWTGYHPFHIRTNETVHDNRGTQIDKQHFVVKDAPAIREEPYITSLDDYKNRVMMQVAAVTWPGRATQRVLESWEKVATELSRHAKFGDQMSGFRPVRERAEALTKHIADTVKRMEAVYDFVRRTIVWDCRFGVLATQDMDDLLETQVGNSADVNLLLTLMLRHAGVVANPVLLSTRSHGKIQTLYPIVDQFNYVICKAEIGNREFLLDATDRFRPYTVLPEAALNHVGFLLKDNTYEWISIEPTGKGKAVFAVNASLSQNGSLSGKVEAAFYDYSASYQRNLLGGKKPTSYVEDLLNAASSGLTVNSHVVNDKDSVGATFLVNADISSASYGQKLDEFVVFHPFVVDRATKNPFQLESRTFPVDFAYPVSATCATNIALPEGWTVKELPKDVNLRLPKERGTYSRLMQLDENLLQVAERLEINNVVFEPAEYPALREFFQRIIAAKNEQVLMENVTAIAPLKVSPPSAQKKKR